MATGDAGAAAGFATVPASKDLRLGYEDLNKKADELAGLLALIKAAALPAGTSIEGHWVAAPAGFALEQGQLMVRTEQPALYAAIGTRYNTGGESATTFRLPDSRGRVAVARGAGSFTTLGAKSGAEQHQLSIAEMPQHRHNVDQPIVALDGESGAGITIGGGSYAVKTAAPTGLQGGNIPHNNVQPSIVLNRAIKL
jgi:microcystin-dependent protein